MIIYFMIDKFLTVEDILNMCQLGMQSLGIVGSVAFPTGCGAKDYLTDTFDATLRGFYL